MTPAIVWTAPEDEADEWGGWHVEFARIGLTADGLTATGTQLGIDPAPYRLDYRLDASGEGFVTRSLEIEASGENWDRRLRLDRNPDGRWTIDGRDADALSGALDCDLGFSPLTNAMPVLRHDLHREPGTFKFLMAWVSVPELSVHALAQRYTHLAAAEDGARVRYESSEDGGEVGFSRDLELDARGLVRLYPGLSRRIGFSSAV